MIAVMAQLVSARSLRFVPACPQAFMSLADNTDLKFRLFAAGHDRHQSRYHYGGMV
jgi:hypothetical protein